MEANRLVRASGKPNVTGCRIVVPSNLNIPFLRKALVGYSDYSIVDSLEFGFHVSYEGAPIPTTRQFSNHKGATLYPGINDAYLQSELGKGRMMGPFDEPILPCSVFSPLNSVPKKGGIDRRVYTDLSYPRSGPNINGGD